jgi:hypothetical protein
MGSIQNRGCLLNSFYS